MDSYHRNWVIMLLMDEKFESFKVIVLHFLVNLKDKKQQKFHSLGAKVVPEARKNSPTGLGPLG